MAECEKSAMEATAEDDDLEDGEIEDDDEVIEIKPEPAPKEKESHKKTPLSDKKSSSSKRSRIVENNEDEEDIASSIANAIAENLKRQGIEPPMPNVQKKSDHEQEQPKKPSKGARKRQRRRERNEKGKEDATANGKKRKVTEDDGFYMVGGSPQHGDGSDSDGSSYSNSNESEEMTRMSYEERRAKRRERHRQSGRDRERDREREKRRRSRSRSRSRSRERERRDRRRERDRDRDSEKEVCLRFAEYGHCPEEDCNRSHDVRTPKKMELCKFWLMECCVKREKCSYMHGDFPCKYYYLGMKCTNKDCKFKHGRPLEENIKQILLKHLDSAPKEILGDFPRIGRENASKMMAETHIKLCQEFNIPCPEATEKKIPSLLDMTIKPPDARFGKNKNRWGHNDSSSSPHNEMLPSTSTSSNEPLGPGDVKLSNLTGILSDKQIESMASIGVITVSQINNLTVAQLNELGLSFATIGEVQATAMNMGKTEDKVEQKIDEKNNEDIDSRAKFNQDIDMRQIAAAETIKSPSSSIMSPNQSDVEEIYKKPETPQHKSNVLMSPPSGTLDLSQYLKDSNLANDDEEENEPGLRIDENYCTSDYEQEDKKDSQSEDDQQGQEDIAAKPFDLLPPSFDSSNFLKATTTKIDISSSVSQLMEMDQPKLPVTTADSPSSRDPRSRDPRKALAAAKESPKVPEIASPTYRDPRQNRVVETEKKSSIYEIESPSEEEDITINIDKDKDMRFNFMNSENGDVDLRFPFTPMANYVPATEIEAAFGVHVFDTYEVKIVDIPKPDYSEIKRSFRQVENTQDPRLKKLCGLGQADVVVPIVAKVPSLPTNSSSVVPSDPRKRRAQEQEMSGPKKLQISTILQNSQHYNELSSSQKMVVNEVLAELTKELKAFHANPTLNKIFDSSFITQRPKLQQVLIGLGVFVNPEGDFEEIKEVPNIPPMLQLPKMQIPPPMIPNLNAVPMISLSQPPPNFPLRPGIIHGIAPLQNMPFATEPNDINFQAMNQMPFGDHFNINRNVGGNINKNNSNNNNNNRRDQRQNSQNFRKNNNNMNRNNNYSRKRRN